MNIIYPKIIFMKSGLFHLVRVAVPKSVFTPAYAILLDTLVETRKSAGITQVELAKKLGRPQPFISYIERGERRIDVIEFYVIAHALGADPRALFDRIIDQLPNPVTI